MAKQSAQEIDRQAADWLARRDAGVLPAAEQEKFAAWLAEDARHLGAYARVESAVAQFERVSAASGDAARMVPQSQPVPGLTRRQTILVGSAAAGLVVAALGTQMLYRYAGQTRYSTPIGGTKIIPLSDGSIITLNTNSEVLVRYTKDRREVRLLQGEALFDVAKIKKRPFFVLAGNTQVRAVGTSFTVMMIPRESVRVLVQEGIVEVHRPDAVKEAPVRVVANMVAVAPASAAIQTQSVARTDVSRDLAWRVGRISFNSTTLSDAAAEFARYSDTHIEIDPAVADQTITGLFVSNDPVGFARAVAISLNLRVQVGDQEVQIFR